MSQFKDRSRRLAREAYWEKHDRDSYECPDCGRKESEINGSFEVHHKNGEPMDNRPENQVALCRLCHNLREDKKPSIEQIRNLRSHTSDEAGTDDTDSSTTPSVYLAGSMDNDSSENDTWRASVSEFGDHGQTEKYTGATPIKVNSPTEVASGHGCGIVEDIAGRDMELVDQSDSIVAYFDKEEQVGTLTELVYAVTQGKPALVLFNRDLVPRGSPSGGVAHHHQSHVYWFLINFLSGDGWNGLDADVTIRAVESRDQIREEFRDWEWHANALSCGLLREDQDLVEAWCTECGTQLKPQPRGQGPWVCADCHTIYCEICGSPRGDEAWIDKGEDGEIPTCSECAAEEFVKQLHDVETGTIDESETSTFTQSFGKSSSGGGL